jgi:hypothetical protein
MAPIIASRRFGDTSQRFVHDERAERKNRSDDPEHRHATRYRNFFRGENKHQGQRGEEQSMEGSGYRYCYRNPGEVLHGHRNTEQNKRRNTFYDSERPQAA